MDDAQDLLPELGTADSEPSSSDSADGVPEVISDSYLFKALGGCCTENGRLLLFRDVKNLIERYAPRDRPTANEIPQEQD
jgi:hypothetical protein